MLQVFFITRARNQLNLWKTTNSPCTANTDPESWHIENSKLYLFFNDEPKQDYIAKIGDGIIQRSEQKWENR